MKPNFKIFDYNCLKFKVCLPGSAKETIANNPERWRALKEKYAQLCWNLKEIISGWVITPHLSLI